MAQQEKHTYLLTTASTHSTFSLPDIAAGLDTPTPPSSQTCGNTPAIPHVSQVKKGNFVWCSDVERVRLVPSIAKLEKKWASLGEAKVDTPTDPPRDATRTHSPFVRLTCDVVPSFLLQICPNLMEVERLLGVAYGCAVERLRDQGTATMRPVATWHTNEGAVPAPCSPIPSSSSSSSSSPSSSSTADVVCLAPPLSDSLDLAQFATIVARQGGWAVHGRSRKRDRCDGQDGNSSNGGLVLRSFGKKLTAGEKEALRRAFTLSSSSSSVDDHTRVLDRLTLTLDYTPVLRQSGNQALAEGSLPTRLFVTMPLDADAATSAPSARRRLAAYALSARPYRGTTSMDHTLAALSVSLARVRRHSLVLDPFCGTGSLLVAAAAAGATVIGADIDGRVLRGLNKKYRGSATTRTNFSHYGLRDRLASVLEADAAASSGSVWRSAASGTTVQRPFLDAIIADPPYGIRESVTKSGGVAGSAYPMHELYEDLLKLAVATLVPGGHLVYWFPATRHFAPTRHLPTHPDLSLVDYPMQHLSRHYGRVLVVLRKLDTPRGGNVTPAPETVDHAAFLGR